MAVKLKYVSFAYLGIDENERREFTGIDVKMLPPVCFTKGAYFRKLGLQPVDDIDFWRNAIVARQREIDCLGLFYG